MAEHGALLTLGNFGAQLLALANPIQEVCEMDRVKVKQALALALDLADDFVVQVEDGAVGPLHRHANFLAVEVHADGSALETAWGAALAFPGDALIAENEGGADGVRGFPVVLVEVTIAAAGHAPREFHAQAPTREVEE